MKIKLDGTISLDGEIQQEENIQCSSGLRKVDIEQDDLNVWQILFALLIPIAIIFSFGYFKGGMFIGVQFLKMFGISITGAFIFCFLLFEGYRMFEEKPTGKDFLMSVIALFGIGLFFIVIKQLLPAAYSFLDVISNVLWGK